MDNPTLFEFKKIWLTWLYILDDEQVGIWLRWMIDETLGENPELPDDQAVALCCEACVNTIE